MNHPLAPFDAVVLCSYGGPNEPDDVLPFMRNATRGRGIPDARLMEVSEHYMLFGGRSPINEQNEALRAALDEKLRSDGVEVPVVVGNRNWLPYLRDVVVDLQSKGHKRILAMATAAYHCYSSCRQYDEDIAGALQGLDGVQIERIDAFAETDTFVEANAEAVEAGLRELRKTTPLESSRLLFVTHSIPVSMNRGSGAGMPESRYDAQHLRVAERIMAQIDASLAGIEWELTYCSRSGAPHIPWLEPDVNDRMAELADQGVTGVLTVPFGFLSDHMEVLYDLDTEARETAEQHNLAYHRAATVGTDPRFVGLLAEELLAHAALTRGEADRRRTVRHSPDGAPRTCCLTHPANQETVIA